MIIKFNSIEDFNFGNSFLAKKHQDFARAESPNYVCEKITQLNEELEINITSYPHLLSLFGTPEPNEQGQYVADFSAYPWVL